MESIIGPQSRFHLLGSSKEVDRVVVPIRNNNAVFNIAIGPIVYKGVKYSDQTLQIEYEGSEVSHLMSLTDQGFNSNLCFDYMVEANRVAEDFCDNNGFVIDRHFASWPVFHALVSKKKTA